MKEHWHHRSIAEKFAIVLAGSAMISGIFLHVVIFYPGSMSVDSWNQYEQALSGLYKDWHPPIMAFVWRLANAIWPGPAGMLAIHLLLFWSALFLFWKYFARKNIWLALLVPFIGFSPTVVGLIGVIWKDIGGAVCALLAAAILIDSAKKKYHQIAIVFAAITYTIAVRRNGLFLAAPLLLLTIADLLKPYFSERSRRDRLISSAILTLITGILFLTSVSFLERAWLNTTAQHLEQTILLHDLAMMSQDTGTDKTPVTFRTPRYSPQSLQVALANLRCVDDCIFGEKATYDITTDKEALDDLKKNWLSAIAAAPTSYLQHRFTLWKSLVGWGFPSCRTEHFYFDNKLGPQISGAPRWQAIYHRFISWTDQHTPFMKIWVWLSIALSALVIIERAGGYQLERKSVVPVAALCYAGGYFPSTVCCDFRYVWVIPILAMLSVLLAVEALLGKSHRPKP